MIESLNGARVLITGGAGMIGSHLCDRLLDAGAHVHIIDDFSRGRMQNLEAASSHPGFSVQEGDIRDCAALATAMDGIDIVFHLAAIRLTQCAEQPRAALEVMADGTFNVVEAAVAAKVKKLVAASSASIYGMAEIFPTAESHHPYDNNTLYGAAKVFNEGIYRAFAETHGLRYTALRPFNVYGPRMDIHGAYTEVLIRWIERIEKKMPLLIFGDGRQSMDFVYVEDVTRAFVLAAATRPELDGLVMNIASGVETSLDTLARTLLATTGSACGIEYGPERKLTAVPRRVADVGKAKEHLGFQAEVSLAEGLRRLVDWWKLSTGRRL